MAAEEGFEPSQTESESVVLPLHNSAICGAAVPCDFNSIQQERRRVKCFFQKNKKRCKTFENAVKLHAAKRLRPLFCWAQCGAQLFQRTLFDARYIAARNPHLFGNLPLGQGGGQTQPIAQADDLALARGQTGSKRPVHGVVSVVLLDSRKPLIFTADHILQRKRVAVAVGLKRIGQRQLERALALLPEMHEQLVLNTLGGIGRQADVFVRPEGAHRLDQPDRADRDEVLGILFEILIFFDDMCDEPEVPLDENMLGLEVSLSVFLDVILLFRRSERAGK